MLTLDTKFEEKHLLCCSYVVLPLKFARLLNKVKRANTDTDKATEKKKT